MIKRTHDEFQTVKKNNYVKGVVALGISLSISQPAFSKNIEGTKSDKDFELCLSKCVFRETKPPPAGSSAERLEVQLSRPEIIRDCKAKCAKTKEQLLLGAPKVKSSSDSEN